MSDDLTRKPDGRYPKWETRLMGYGAIFLLGTMFGQFFGGWAVGLAFLLAALSPLLGFWMDGRK